MRQLCFTVRVGLGIYPAIPDQITNQIDGVFLNSIPLCQTIRSEPTLNTAAFQHRTAQTAEPSVATRRAPTRFMHVDNGYIYSGLRQMQRSRKTRVARANNHHVCH